MVELLRDQAKEIVDKSLIEWLYSQDNIDRIKNYKEHEKYYDGDLGIRIPSNVGLLLDPELAYAGNFCRSVVDAAVGFLSGGPLSIEIVLPKGEEPEEDDEGTQEQALEDLDTDRREAEAWVYKIFRDSKLLFENFTKALRIQGKKGEFALKIYPALENNTIISYKISVLRPDICFPKWKDEEYEEMEYFAIKYQRLNPKTGKEEFFAQVLWHDKVQEYVKPINNPHLREWVLWDEWETNYGFIPIIWVRNKADDGPWSESDITSDLKDIQDGFNKLLTDLFHTADSEAFRTAFILGASPPKKEDGTPIKIESGPGKIHWIPGMGEKVPQLGHFPPSNFDGLLNSIDKVLDLVSVVSKVPKNELSRSGSGSVPTGVALKTIYQPFIGKCDEKRGLLKDGIERLIGYLFKMAEVDGVNVDFKIREYESKVYIEHGLPSDEKEQMEVLEAELRNKIKSRETAMQERGIEDIEEEKERIQAEMQEMDVYGDEGRLRDELAALDITPEPEI